VVLPDAAESRGQSVIDICVPRTVAQEPRVLDRDEVGQEPIRCGPNSGTRRPCGLETISWSEAGALQG